MILAEHNEYRVEWQGDGPFNLGTLFAIMQGTKILHRGHRIYISVKWWEITGQNL